MKARVIIRCQLILNRLVHPPQLRQAFKPRKGIAQGAMATLTCRGNFLAVIFHCFFLPNGLGNCSKKALTESNQWSGLRLRRSRMSYSCAGMVITSFAFSCFSLSACALSSVVFRDIAKGIGLVRKLLLKNTGFPINAFVIQSSPLFDSIIARKLSTSKTFGTKHL